MSDKVSHMRDL